MTTTTTGWIVIDFTHDDGPIANAKRAFFVAVELAFRDN
jgi:hypothetical protein